MRVALIGAGSWGTAAAGLVAPHVDEVIVWSHDDDVPESINTNRMNPRYLVDYVLPDNVIATLSLEETFENVDAAVIVVPSAFLRSTCEQMKPYVPAELPLICLTKGIEFSTGNLMTDVLADVLGNPARIAALSGPNHAEEICKGSFSAAVVAAENKDLAEFFKSCFLSQTFRVYTSSDVVGVELCAAMKNVIAIVCGIASGFKYGDNTLALLMTRGLAEISRLVVACGGDPLTCMGLAGMGDLIATCSSQHSRNRTFGESLAAGETLEQYQNRTHMVVEGAQAARSVAQLARTKGVDCPMTFALEALLWNNADIDDIVSALVERLPTEEFYGL